LSLCTVAPEYGADGGLRDHHKSLGCSATRAAKGGAGCGRSRARWFLTLPAPVVASSLFLWLQSVYGVVSPATRRPAAPRLSRFSQLVRVTADCWCACMPGGSASADTARAGS